MSYFQLAFWLNRDQSVRHGYTPGSEDDRPTFRIGPLVMAWELSRDKP